MGEVAVAIYALDVGQGDCTFVVSGRPDDGVVLFDANDRYVAERFVVDHGIRTLHAVVVSHLDRDHIHGMLPFLRWFLSDPGRQVGQVYVGLDRARPAIGKTAGALVEALLDWSKAGRFAIYAPHRDESPKQVWAGPNWTADLVLPHYATLLDTEMADDDEPNRCSVALRVSCGSRSVMVGGDVPLVSWEQLEPAFVRADAFRSPHHGGGIDEGDPRWSESDLYETAQPETVVVSVGTCNGHGHPTDNHLRGIDPSKRRLICTQLTPRCHPDVTGVRNEMLRQASRVSYAPYRHRYDGGARVARPRGEVPCAGSMSIELLDDGTIRYEPPREDWHDSLLTRMAIATPRCRPRSKVAP